MHCVACVSPVAKRDDKVLYWRFFLSFFFFVFMISMLFFYLLIFELTGPNLMKNRPCQNHSTLPGLLLFSSFIYFNTFLKFLSLTKESIARKLDLSFLNNYQDLMTERLSKSSLDFKKHSLPLNYYVKFFSCHTCHYLNQKKSKRDQVEFDYQKWPFFLVKS